VVEEGTHDLLPANDGLYAELLQVEGYRCA
jgi:hypothetical protein